MNKTEPMRSCESDAIKTILRRPRGIPLLDLRHPELAVVLVLAFSSALAMLIFLTAAMDNPFRGEFSVSSDAFQYVLDHVMTKADNGS